MQTKNDSTDSTDTGGYETFCHRCGEKYDPGEQDMPENATFYWVPDCPACGAKCTANTVDSTWMEILCDPHPAMDDWERRRKQIHFHGRLWHGRLSGLSVEELIEIAQYFDERSDYGKKWGPNPERTVAFRVRRQAREKVMNDE